MKVVIMAGGKGTRISSLYPDIPKPMIKIGDKPVLQREIESLRDQGYRDFIITISHLGNIIENYFKDGSEFGVNIEYYNEVDPLGNAGALFKIKDKLSDDFILINGDIVFEIDINRFVQYHKEKGSYATIIAHPNNHPYDSSLIISSKENKVIDWLSKEDERPLYYKNKVNAGIHVLSKKILNANINKEKIDLDRDILKPLSNSGKLFNYHSPEYIKDMGTPERYKHITEDFYNGLINKKSLLNKQKAFFLDRDGTINKNVGFLTDINSFELMPNVSDAIRLINESGYLAIVVTNQPVIARGEVTYEELDEIHNKMETLLGNDGAYLDAIYYCPHHPDSGYKGEIKELKISCECRKPKPGMLLKAAEDFNIDLSKSYMIGDSENDVLAGKNAGCNSLLIEEGKDLLFYIKEVLNHEQK